MSACIDEKRNLYVWGALVSIHEEGSKSRPTALCIKQPEQVSNLKVNQIEIGASMAFAIEHKTNIPHVIGTNQSGELGLSKEDIGDNQMITVDTEPRKVFIVQEAL